MKLLTDAFYMKPQTILLSVTLCVASVPALAQVTVTAAPEVSALMADCTPTDARGAAIVAGLRARGWVEPEAAERREALTTLAAAHLWSFLPDRPAAVQIELLGQLTDAVERALQDGGAFLTLADERALVLWDIDSLSCLWAGPETRTVDTLAVQLGGTFPESTGTVTRALSQSVGVGGQNWRRQMAVGPPRLRPNHTSDGLSRTGPGVGKLAKAERLPLKIAVFQRVAAWNLGWETCSLTVLRAWDAHN